MAKLANFGLKGISGGLQVYIFYHYPPPPLVPRYKSRNIDKKWL